MKTQILNNVVKYYEGAKDGHGLDHIKKVVENLSNLITIHEKRTGEKVNREVLLTAALYHDAGSKIDRKRHHIISAEIVRNEEYLRNIFTEEEIELIATMCEEHRSSGGPCSNIYSAMLNDADSLLDSIYNLVERTWTYNHNHKPNASEEEIYNVAYEHLKEKFGRNGYQQYRTEYARELLKELMEKVYYTLENEEEFKKVYNQVSIDKGMNIMI